jgi:hypothetical protein
MAQCDSAREAQEATGKGRDYACRRGQCERGDDASLGGAGAALGGTTQERAWWVMREKEKKIE